MIEEMDYCLVPEDLFQELKQEFGLMEGQSPIARLTRYQFIILKLIY